MYLKLPSCFPESLGKAVQAGNNDPLINEGTQLPRQGGNEAGDILMKGTEKTFAKP